MCETVLDMRLLVVEDDDIIGSTLEGALTKEGYDVDWAKNGERGLLMGLEHPYSAIVLDLMLPKLNGMQVCARLRKASVNTPILMLTARDGIDDRVQGLDHGADDYLPKPFDFKELTARIRALIRRNQPVKAPILTAEDLEIDTTDRSVRRAGELVKLTPREYDLLEALVRNRGRVLSRELIIGTIWGDDESLSNTVNFHVTSLRKKIDQNRDRPLIETVHGFGYRLRDPQ